MKTWELNMRVYIADSWIADGFDLNERLGEIEECIRSMLPFAIGNEVNVKIDIVQCPSNEVIENLRNGKTKIKC